MDELVSKDPGILFSNNPFSVLSEDCNVKDKAMEIPLLDSYGSLCVDSLDCRSPASDKLI